MHDIHRAKVAPFPDEKFSDIDELENHRNEHGIAKAIELFLFGSKRENDQRPSHHAKAAIGEHFDVPTEHARIKLHTPEKVEDKMTS